MKEKILKLLSKLTKSIINKHKPFVIGVTGTVGKTTATNFIYEFLNQLYPGRVYKSEYDYNGEFGLPLSILKSKSPNKNIFLWLVIFIKGIYLMYSKNYPEYIVLEYGFDRKGEMAFMTDIVKPDIGIVLNVSPNHVTQFPDYNDYIKEKTLLGDCSEKLIFNSDDEVLAKHFEFHKDKISYGIKNDAKIKGSDIVSTIDKLSFNILVKGKTLKAEFSLIGDHQAYNILPVFALGEMLGVDSEKTLEILGNIQAQKGRGTILKGINDASIIDGSYNGGFLAMSTGIRYMQNLSSEYNKILFLGDMRELGSESRKMHSELANIIEEGNIDHVVLVGEEMNRFVFLRIAEQLGSKNVFWFNCSRKAGDKVREIISSNEKKSVIYVKGSQNTIFLEEGIKKFLFNVQDVNKLCRQSPYWLSIKEDFFSQIL